ncbi:MAG: Lar family restriction alleviation protein [Lachnospiraceae bacterium]|nr:Lar family restriction alleviation protein [Lachnospiraceae bacterium]
MKKSDIKSCPFCGGQVDVIIPGGRYFKFYQIRCDGCGANSKECNTPEDAAELWNKRIGEN